MRNNRESGQAMIELAVMLVALLAVVLGVVFVCGILRSGNIQFLRSKTVAEISSRTGGAPMDSSSDISRWNYGTLEIWGETTVRSADGSTSTLSAATATIPFTSMDTISHYGGNALGEIPAAFNDDEASNSDSYRYKWMQLQDFDSTAFRADFTPGLSNAIGAAGLVRGRAASDRNALHDFDKGYKGDAAAGMRKSFTIWFGVTIPDRTIYENPVFDVYIPVVEKQE